MSDEILFGSVCSGIEAATVAFEPLGWRAAWLAEIDPFACAVLKHHYPAVPNLGDMTTIARRVLAGEVPAPDVLCGGTPCQAFSVAGKRESLGDARGNLTLKFVELADAIDHVRARSGKPAAVIVWENVPGVLSTKDNAFGCFLAGLAGEDEPLVAPGKRWEDAGAVYGPRRAIAWRTLDAQYFGLAQRRRRVFLVASARDGFDPAEVLFEWQGVRRDTPPSREARQDVAAGTLRSTQGGVDVDHVRAGHVVAATLDASFGRRQGASGQDANHGHSHLISDTLRSHPRPGSNSVGALAFGGNQTSGPRDVSSALSALSAHGGTGRHDFESETFIAHTLRGEGFDASEDGTGRGTPLVPVLAFDTTQVTSVANRSNPKAGDPCHPPAIAFDCKASGQNGFGVGEIASTQRAMGHADSHQNGGGHQAVMTASRVRRLTPVECERLQGFPDGWTAIPWRGKPADQCPDGPRYKALGNSWAVPCARWVGMRIDNHLAHRCAPTHPGA